jgi:hypothetical protein
MKKDIVFPEVRGVKIAIAPGTDEEEWKVYLINENEQFLDNVLVTSKGYGEQNNETQKTSTIRQHFDQMAPKSHLVIESIIPEVFHLNNEYWISYYIGQELYDKRFVFVPESIKKENLTYISALNSEGILHE